VRGGETRDTGSSSGVADSHVEDGPAVLPIPDYDADSAEPDARDSGTDRSEVGVEDPVGVGLSRAKLINAEIDSLTERLANGSDLAPGLRIRLRQAVAARKWAEAQSYVDIERRLAAKRP
jgi:hypothetical protein